MKEKGIQMMEASDVLHIAKSSSILCDFCVSYIAPTLC